MYTNSKQCIYNNRKVCIIDGELYAWGSNEFGQLGIGLGPTNVSKPALVITLDGLPISYIACGGYHSFVVSKSGKINIKICF